jgi:clan AA aspartic protease (TIGR02281 family)
MNCEPCVRCWNHLEERDIAKLVITFRLPALAAVLVLNACQQSPAPAPEYRPGEAGTVDHALCLLGFEAVPLRETTTGHHLVQATVNGRSGSFVLDTGANATVIDSKHAQAFGLSGGSAGLRGVAGGLAGAATANQVSIETFGIGSLQIRQRRIVTADLGQLLETLGRFSGTPVYGLIGQDVLTEHRAIVDVAKPMLYLMAEDKDPAPIPAEQCRSEGDATPGP